MARSQRWGGAGWVEGKTNGRLRMRKGETARGGTGTLSRAPEQLISGTNGGTGNCLVEIYEVR